MSNRRSGSSLRSRTTAAGAGGWSAHTSTTEWRSCICLTAVIGLPFAIGHPLPAPQIGIIVLLGVVQLGLPYVLYSIAIRRVSALEAVLIPMIEPILNPLWVALQRGEVPGRWSLAGGALVLSSVLVRELIRTNPVEPR